MSHIQSLGEFRSLRVVNKSPFDATTRFLTRYVSPGGAAPQEIGLGTVVTGRTRDFSIRRLANGEEVALHIQSAATDGWTATSSPTYITFTRKSSLRARYLVKGTMQKPVLQFDVFVRSSIYVLLLPLPYHLEKADQAGNEPVPEPSGELKDKSRWMQCIVQNKTQFLIVHDSPAYIYSGRFDDPPQNIDPYSNMVFTVCNGDAATGATGGTTFRVILDAATEYPFALGWTAPLVGAFAAGVVESANAEDGYKGSSEGGNTVQSTEEFDALDENGEEVSFRFELTATPGRKALFVVSQVRV